MYVGSLPGMGGLPIGNMGYDLCNIVRSVIVLSPYIFVFCCKSR